MNQYHVYILHCADNTYYVGMTSNLKKRMRQHASGFYDKAYTYNRRPFQLIYIEEFRSVLKTIAREKQLKRWSAHKKKALAEGDTEKLSELAACQNITHFLRRSEREAEK